MKVPHPRQNEYQSKTFTSETRHTNCASPEDKGPQELFLSPRKMAKPNTSPHRERIPKCSVSPISKYRTHRQKKRRTAIIILPQTIPGWHVPFRKALIALKLGSLPRRSIIQLLDNAAGIRTTPSGTHGATRTADIGTRCLDPQIVRPVEYEGLARHLRLSELEVGLLHSLFSQDFRRFHVSNEEIATDYLMRAIMRGNRYAKKVLDWLAPHHGRGLDGWSGLSGRLEYLRAIECKERERAVEIGRFLGGAEFGYGPARPDKTMLMTLSTQEQKAMSANNLGYLLLHGARGIEKNEKESVLYFRMAINWGSAAAASNLGLMYAKGNKAVERNCVRAKGLYELAIARGERDYAPRNLAILLAEGGNGVRRDYASSLRLLILSIKGAEGRGREKSAETLGRAVGSWRFRFVGRELRSMCRAVLEEERETS